MLGTVLRVETNSCVSSVTTPEVRYYSHPHSTEEQNLGLERYSDSLEVTQWVRDGPRAWT